MNVVLTVMLWLTYLISLYITAYWLVVFLTERDAFKKRAGKDIKLIRYPLISVLVPAYNEQDTVIPVLRSIISLDYPKERLEVIVINDGSSDKTADRVNSFIKEHREFKITLICQKNSGKGASLNHGLKYARGEFFACLDADSFVDPLTLKKMLSMYEQDKDLVIVTPAMKVKSPKTFLQRIQWLEYIVSLFMARLMSHLDCIYVAPGPFSLYRTAVIRKMGGFDKDNLTEDQEIAYRAQKYHYKIKQCHDGYVYTIAPKNLRMLYKQRNRWLKGGFLNIVKYRGLIWNRKYGDFGIMQMSINLFIFVVSIATLFFFGLYVLKPLYEGIRNLYLVNFDIRPFLKDLFKFDFVFLSVDIEKTVILYLLLAISFSIIYISHKNANERFRAKDIVPMIAYFLIYYVVISFVIVMIFFEMLMEKKHSWRF